MADGSIAPAVRRSRSEPGPPLVPPPFSSFPREGSELIAVVTGSE